VNLRSHMPRGYVLNLTRTSKRLRGLRKVCKRANEKVILLDHNLYFEE
jgi:hypothetical protein